MYFVLYQYYCSCTKLHGVPNFYNKSIDHYINVFIKMIYRYRF